MKYRRRRRRWLSGGEREADALAVCVRTVVVELLITENVRRTRDDNNMDTVRRNGRRAHDKYRAGPHVAPPPPPPAGEPTHPPPPVGQTRVAGPVTGARSVGPPARRAATQRWRGRVRHEAATDDDVMMYLRWKIR